MAKLDVLNISGKRAVNHHYGGHNFFDNLYSPEDKKKMKTRNIAEMKIAFSEYYLGLVLLQNYETLNFTAFRKILKKHDKVCKILMKKHGKVCKRFKKHNFCKLLKKYTARCVEKSIGVLFL